MSPSEELIRLIVIGGANEARKKPEPHLLSQLIKGGHGGKITDIIFDSPSVTSRRRINCSFYYWTGEDKDNDSFSLKLFSGEVDRMDLNPFPEKVLIIIGWSYGGDTAYQLADRMGNTRDVNALITLDPVSLRSPPRREARDAKQFLPVQSELYGKIRKPFRTDYWFHAYTRSPSKSDRIKLTNVISKVGGAWNAEVATKDIVLTSGLHSSTEAMLRGISKLEKFQSFRKTIGM